VTPPSGSRTSIRLGDWLAQAQAVVDAAGADLVAADSATFRSAFRRLARAVRALPITNIQLPLVLTSSTLGPLIRLRTRTSASRATWERALRQLFAVLSVAGLAREPRHFRVRSQRRSTAVVLDPEAFELLPKLRALRAQLLHAKLAPLDRDEEETAVVGAVLGIVIFSGITLPHLRETLVALERDALDVDSGCLTLSVRRGASRVAANPTCWQRFALHPWSVLLWGRLLLRLPQEAPRPHSEECFLLPPGWRNVKRLRGALRVTLKTAGFPTWQRFLQTVRIEMLLTTQAPVSVLRRAGRLVTSAAPASDWHRFGWTIAHPAGAYGGAVRTGLQVTQPLQLRDRHTPHERATRVQIRRVVTALNSDSSGHERARMADTLERSLHPPEATGPESGIAESVVRWAIHLLRRRRYRANTVRTWLSRISRALDTVDSIPSLEGLRDPERLIAFVEGAIAFSVALESRRAMRTSLRQYLGFLAAQGVQVAAIEWSARRLLIPTEGRLTSLLSPGEIRVAVEMVMRTRVDGLALATAMVLAGFGGLRRIEVCRLHTRDIPRDRRWTVSVRYSKTAAGRRAVALGPVLPPWAMAVLERYAAWRADRSGPDPHWLLTPEGAPWDPDKLATRIIAVLRHVSGKPATFHSLRRAAATWLWVRWLHQAYGLELPPAMAIDGPVPDAVRELLGADATVALWSLARFLGHRSPAITMERYLLAIDWFEAQAMRASADVQVPLRAAAAALEVSERRTRQLVLPMSGSVSLWALLAAQRDRLARERARRQRSYAGEALRISQRASSSQDVNRGAA
jgi:integrase